MILIRFIQRIMIMPSKPLIVITESRFKILKKVQDLSENRMSNADR